VTARALLDGEVSVADFRPDRVTEARITGLLARTSAVSIEVGQDGVGDWGAQVIVDYEDGHEVVETVDDISSRGSARRISWDEIEGKFRDCASGVLPNDDTARLLTGLRGIGEVPDVAALIELAAT
jgi:hypothetical protein